MQNIKNAFNDSGNVLKKLNAAVKKAKNNYHDVFNLSIRLCL